MMKKFDDKQTGLLSSYELKTLKGRIIYLAFLAVLLSVCLISVIPAVWTILTAFKDTQEIYTQFSFFPKELSFHRIISRISESWIALELGDSIVNTIIMSIGELGMTLVVCGFGGYVLSKMKPQGLQIDIYTCCMDDDEAGAVRRVPNYISFYTSLAYDIGE